MPEDVRSRFAPVAANYTRSSFHASSERLQEVLDLARPKPGDLALDVATGTGNTAFALAPYVRRVIGLDVAALPFQDETFDLYTVRAAPHHFADIDAFLSEAFRVLKPDRDAAFIDCSPPAAARDVLHEVELRRDPSHVKALTVEEWSEHFERAGFEIGLASRRELGWDYDAWMGNMGVEPALAGELAGVIESAQGEALAQLHPERREGKLRHAYWHCLIRAHKHG